MNTTAPTRHGFPRPSGWPVWVVPLLITPFVLGGSFGAQSNSAEGPHSFTSTQLDAFGVALLLTAIAALLFRRRYPVQTVLVVAGLTLLYFLRAYTYGPAPLPLFVALIAVVTSGHRILAWAGTFGGLGGFFVLSAVIGVPFEERGRGDRLFPVEQPDWTDAAMVLGWFLVALTGAELIRITSERRTESENKRREEERRRASDERLQMARELHDVLAHNISMINVQAGVALHLMDEQPEQARTALAAIKEASKEALTEMRSVIGVLRQQGEEAPRSPTAGLARLEELLERARAAGLRVHTEIGSTDELPAGIDLAVFRLVQESLTNVTRHAGPGPVTAWVRIAYGEGQISVEIDDDGRGVQLLHDHSGGNGLHGMRERVAALGGEFSAGPRPGGGFRVHAVLPVQDTAREAQPSGTRGMAEGK